MHHQMSVDDHTGSTYPDQYKPNTAFGSHWLTLGGSSAFCTDTKLGRCTSVCSR